MRETNIINQCGFHYVDGNSFSLVQNLCNGFLVLCTAPLYLIFYIIVCLCDNVKVYFVV